MLLLTEFFDELGGWLMFQLFDIVAKRLESAGPLLGGAKVKSSARRSEVGRCSMRYCEIQTIPPKSPVWLVWIRAGHKEGRWQLTRL